MVGIQQEDRRRTENLELLSDRRIECSRVAKATTAAANVETAKPFGGGRSSHDDKGAAVAMAMVKEDDRMSLLWLAAFEKEVADEFLASMVASMRGSGTSLKNEPLLGLEPGDPCSISSLWKFALKSVTAVDTEILANSDWFCRSRE